MKPYEERKARERQAATQIKNGLPPVDADGHRPSEGTGRTAEILAKKAGVGTRTMNRAIKVREQGPEQMTQTLRNKLRKVDQSTRRPSATLGAWTPAPGHRCTLSARAAR